MERTNTFKSDGRKPRRMKAAKNKWKELQKRTKMERKGKEQEGKLSQGGRKRLRRRS